jgi:hypothetical protein
MRSRSYVVLLTAVVALASSACGADSPAGPTGGGGGGGVSGPCDLTEPAVVAEVFGGTVSGEMPEMARNCRYDVVGGVVDVVHVYYYGPASQWSGIRGGYVDNRGPLTDVAGVGDEAFHPGDVGAEEIVVRSGDVVFAVGLVIGETYGDDARAKVRELAIRIATDAA